MFAPYPLTDDGWYVIPGQLKDGTVVDLFRDGAPVSWEKPSLVSALYKNQRRRKYMMNLWKKRYANHRLHYGRYLCRDWNSRHQEEKQLDRFFIYFIREETLPDYQISPPQKILLWRHFCFRESLP